jgi:hypothetical protein
MGIFFSLIPAYQAYPKVPEKMKKPTGYTRENIKKEKILNSDGKPISGVVKTEKIKNYHDSSPNEKNKSPEKKNKSPKKKNKSPDEENNSSDEENNSSDEENKSPDEENNSSDEENNSSSSPNPPAEKKKNSSNEENYSLNKGKIKLNIYWIRHALSCANIHKLYKTTTSNKPLNLQQLRKNRYAPNSSLSAIGIWQCKELSKEIDKIIKEKSIDYVGSSELLRAIQTAAIVFDETKKYNNKFIHVVPNIGENRNDSRLNKDNEADDRGETEKKFNKIKKMEIQNALNYSGGIYKYKLEKIFSKNREIEYLKIDDKFKIKKEISKPDMFTNNKGRSDPNILSFEYRVLPSIIKNIQKGKERKEITIVLVSHSHFISEEILKQNAFYEIGNNKTIHRMPKSKDEEYKKEMKKQYKSYNNNNNENYILPYKVKKNKLPNLAVWKQSFECDSNGLGLKLKEQKCLFPVKQGDLYVKDGDIYPVFSEFKFEYNFSDNKFTNHKVNLFTSQNSPYYRNSIKLCLILRPDIFSICHNMVEDDKKNKHIKDMKFFIYKKLNKIIDIKKFKQHFYLNDIKDFIKKSNQSIESKFKYGIKKHPIKDNKTGNNKKGGGKNIEKKYYNKLDTLLATIEKDHNKVSKIKGNKKSYNSVYNNITKIIKSDMKKLKNNNFKSIKNLYPYKISKELNKYIKEKNKII